MKASALIKKLNLSPETREQIAGKVAELKEKSRVTNIVKGFHECAQCGTFLEFTYRTDWVKCFVYEEASCPHCQGQIPLRKYRLN